MTIIIHHSFQDLDNYIAQMQSHGKEPVTNKEFKWANDGINPWDTQALSRSKILRSWKEYRNTQYKPVDI